MRRVVRICLLGLVLVLTVSGTALAEYSGPYYTDVAFGNLGVGAGSISEFSPTRSGGSETFYGVNSKFDQPRHVSSTNSNPHQGVDLNYTSGPIYPVRTGWIAAKSTSSITIQIDVNGDSIRNDSLYCTYNHLINVTGSPIGTLVLHTTAIADVDPNLLDQSGINVSHLHFGNRASVSGEWIKNEPYYRLGSPWNYGKDLDLISVVSLVSGTVNARIYVKDNTVTRYINAGDVRIYWRVSGTTTWYSDSMARSDSSLFQFNLASRVGYVWADYLIRVVRTDQKSSFPQDYYWAFDPPKYARPNQDPTLQSPPAYYTKLITP